MHGPEGTRLRYLYMSRDKRRRDIKRNVGGRTEDFCPRSRNKIKNERGRVSGLRSNPHPTGPWEVLATVV